jgi:hypothetical protein
MPFNDTEYPDLEEAIDAAAFVAELIYSAISDCDAAQVATRKLQTEGRRHFGYDDPNAFDLNDRDREVAGDVARRAMAVLANRAEQQMTLVLKALRGDPAPALAVVQAYRDRSNAAAEARKAAVAMQVAA